MKLFLSRKQCSANTCLGSVTCSRNSSTDCSKYRADISTEGQKVKLQQRRSYILQQAFSNSTEMLSSLPPFFIIFCQLLVKKNVPQTEPKTEIIQTHTLCFRILLSAVTSKPQKPLWLPGQLPIPLSLQISVSELSLYQWSQLPGIVLLSLSLRILTSSSLLRTYIHLVSSSI